MLSSGWEQLLHPLCTRCLGCHSPSHRGPWCEWSTVSKVLVPPSPYLPAKTAFILHVRDVGRVTAVWNGWELGFLPCSMALIAVFGGWLTGGISLAFLKASRSPRARHSHFWVEPLLCLHKHERGGSFCLHLPQFNSTNYKRIGSLFPLLCPEQISLLIFNPVRI